MGTFNVELRIGTSDFSAWETVSALVDTGATCSMVPASLLRCWASSLMKRSNLNSLAARSSSTKPDGQHLPRQTGLAGLGSFLDRTANT